MRRRRARPATEAELRRSQHATTHQRLSRRIASAGPIEEPAEHTYVPGGVAAKPTAHGADSIRRLQGQVGNAVVTPLLERASRSRVQRAPLPDVDDPAGYTKVKGVKNVAQSGMTRCEVHGLKYGITGGFQAKYSGTESGENQLTDQSPDQMAVVIMPDKLDEKRPIQVILHFHGWGFRQDGKGKGDPYAGYLVASGRTNAKKGTVRDVDQEHWAQQMGAVVGARTPQQPQIVAVLVQGRGKSEFGSFPTHGYIQEVFSKVPRLSKVSTYSLILSAHSGGGGTKIAPMVNSGEAQAADKNSLKTDPDRAKAAGPADLVTLFDAEGSYSTTSWVVQEIEKLGKALKADPANARTIIANSPKFRGYYAKGGYYAAAFDTAAWRLRYALAKLPSQWTDTTSPDVTVADLFRIVEVDRKGVDHEHLIGGTTDPKVGALADALAASLDPTVDRAKALHPLPPPKPAPKPKAAPKKKLIDI